MIEKLVRENIIKLKPYTSARDSFWDGILMDANENSLGSVIPDTEHLNLNRYPDPKQNELRKALSEYLGISANKLFFGVGSDEIIDLLIRIFCEPGADSVLIPQPTYGMFKVACDVNNIKTIEVPLNRNFQASEVYLINEDVVVRSLVYYVALMSIECNQNLLDLNLTMNIQLFALPSLHHIKESHSYFSIQFILLNKDSATCIPCDPA